LGPPEVCIIEIEVRRQLAGIAGLKSGGGVAASADLRTDWA